MSHWVATLVLWGVNHWIFLVLGILVLVLAGAIFRIIRNVLIVLVLAALVAVFVFHVPVKNITKIAQQVVSQTQKITQPLVHMVNDEIKTAKYTQGANGTYTIQAKDFEIIGHNQSPNATIVVNGKKFNINLGAFGSTVQKQIQKMQNNSTKSS